MGQRAREERKGIKTEQPYSQEQASLGVIGVWFQGQCSSMEAEQGHSGDLHATLQGQPKEWESHTIGV